jgi:hypothetical protein
MTNHTPGPLAIEICEENGPFLDSFYLRAQVTTWDGNTAERIVCRYPTGTGQFSEVGRENLANARLHASAPDLLSALSAIVADYHALQRSQGASANIGAIGSEFTAGAWLGSRLGGHIAHAESAIAKAKGEA